MFKIEIFFHLFFLNCSSSVHDGEGLSSAKSQIKIFTFTESAHDAMKMCPLQNDRWKCQISYWSKHHDTTAWATDTFDNMHSFDCYGKKHYHINSHCMDMKIQKWKPL